MTVNSSQVENSIKTADNSAVAMLLLRNMGHYARPDATACLVWVCLFFFLLTWWNGYGWNYEAIRGVDDRVPEKSRIENGTELGFSRDLCPAFERSLD